MDEQRITSAAADQPTPTDLSPERFKADPMERHGQEWGLASLLAGGMLGVGALLFLVLAVVTVPIRHHWDKFSIGVIFTLHTLLSIAVLPVNVITIVAGLRGFLSSRRRGQPVAFAVLGILLSLLGFGLCVCAGVAGFAVLLGD